MIPAWGKGEKKIQNARHDDEDQGRRARRDLAGKARRRTARSKTVYITKKLPSVRPLGNRFSIIGPPRRCHATPSSLHATRTSSDRLDAPAAATTPFISYGRAPHTRAFSISLLLSLSLCPFHALRSLYLYLVSTPSLPASTSLSDARVCTSWSLSRSLFSLYLSIPPSSFVS